MFAMLQMPFDRKLEWMRDMGIILKMEKDSIRDMAVAMTSSMIINRPLTPLRYYREALVHTCRIFKHFSFRVSPALALCCIGFILSMVAFLIELRW